jgi:hypothetical protein
LTWPKVKKNPINDKKPFTGKGKTDSYTIKSMREKG